VLIERLKPASELKSVSCGKTFRPVLRSKRVLQHMDLQFSKARNL